MGLPPALTQAGISMPSWITASNTYYGYCSIADVQLLDLQLAGDTSSFGNNSVVAQCITEASIEMHKSLELVYQMPYVGADLTIKATLSELNAKLAAANIYDRIYGANEPDMSTAAANLRAYVEQRLLGIIDGEENWAAPIGDAMPNGDRPAFPHSAVASVQPTGTTGDPWSDSPIFVIGKMTYHRPTI